MTSVPHKRCPRCGEAKPREDFTRNRSSFDGLASYCRDCIKSVKRESYLRNRESVLEKDRLYRESNVEHRRAQQAEYRRLNAAEISARTAKYRAEHAEEIRQKVAAWREANPGHVRAQHARRKALLTDAECGCVTREHLAMLLAMPCVYCGDAAEHIDHIMPLSRGGRNCLRNLAPACGPCNWGKGTKILEDPPVSTFSCTGVDID